jgi:NAD(P)-dependent dehydrogenase (short-subunit alcohol dehydrogenase family)
MGLAEPTASVFDLTGRLALVTGAGQGVGAAIAKRLAIQGATVAVNDISTERATTVVDQIRSTGGRALEAVADLTNSDSLAAMLQEVRQESEGIDILINNAGVPSTGFYDASFESTTSAEWRTWFALNVDAVMECVHAVIPVMVGRGWGRIVTVSSDAGRFGEPRMAAYCAAKSAALGFSKSIAKEYGPAGITCNCVSLGSLRSPEESDEDARHRARHYPVRRLGTPEDVAPAVLWLVSDEASWVTGQTISVNGGYVTT